MSLRVKGFKVKPIKALYTFLMLVVAVIWLYPFILSIMTSVKPSMEIMMNGPLVLPEDPIFTPYKKVWDLLGFKTLLVNSLILAIGGSLLAVLLSLTPAYALSRFKIPGREIIFVIILTGMMVPQQTVIIPLWEILNRIGLLNTVTGLIIVHAVYGLPFVLLILRGFVVGIPVELEDAARVDGCSDFGIFRHVIVPLSVPAMAVAFTLNFINIWKEFFFALILLSNNSLFPVTVGLLKVTQDQYFTSWNLPAAATIIAQVPVLILYVLAYKWITKGIYTGAVKG